MRSFIRLQKEISLDRYSLLPAFFPFITFVFLSPFMCQNRDAGLMATAVFLKRALRCGTWYQVSLSKYHFSFEMASFGMLRLVAPVRTDVSEERSSSFIRVIRMDELRTTLAVTSNRRTTHRFLSP
jgi:hypothetical protein